MEINQVKQLLCAGLPGAQVEVTGDGRHFEATIVSSIFEGKSLLQRHRLVMATVRDEIASDALHALSLNTKTPDEIAS
jgi:acid stress-induced BolA-like protein IbaG/YrbA